MRAVYYTLKNPTNTGLQLVFSCMKQDENLLRHVL
jgi:hypothetical protein